MNTVFTIEFGLPFKDAFEALQNKLHKYIICAYYSLSSYTVTTYIDANTFGEYRIETAHTPGETFHNWFNSKQREYSNLCAPTFSRIYFFHFLIIV